MIECAGKPPNNALHQTAAAAILSVRW